MTETMTIGELREALETQPELADLLCAYIEAKKENPEGVTRAMPVILKVLTDGKKRGGEV